MISFDWIEANAIQTGQPVGVQLGLHMLAALWIDDVLTWAIDGELVTADEARWILKNFT
ncbi:hypothetical protein PQR75_06595 [Paraburkholderia fungorum]|uniref:hypothetical protein n=1 Tax=Paraburkholderia fungorum TaxID=134537 RepID=UPI0038BBEE8B